MPPPPAECAAFGRAETNCDHALGVPERLAQALEQTDAVARDAALACVETDAGGHVALVRALRAELAPLVCGDALVTPFLEASPALSDEDETLLLGLMLGAQFNRLLSAPPALTPPFDKPHFLEFFDASLKPWIITQAVALGELSERAARLRGYGKAVAAIEAGIADLRFVQTVRAVALPKELANDSELKNVYFGALDEALEPRKARGRDAALVGLRFFAELGVLSDARLPRARKVLSELYGGSRVTVLDELLLPPLAPVTPSTIEQRLAASLPTYYAARMLLSLPDATAPALIRALGERGVPAPLRARWDAAALSTEARGIYAALELRRGITYFAAPAFAHAEALGSGVNGDANVALVAALGRALANSPKDAASLMLASPRLTPPLGESDQLSALTRGGRNAGLAEFDLALIRSLTPPDETAGADASVGFWTAQAKSFGHAASALADPAQRSRARDLADDAKQTAQALRKSATH